VQTATNPEITASSDLTTSAAASFAAEPPSATSARRFVAGFLRPLVRNDLVEVAALLTTELATNSLLHAQSAVDVEVQVSPREVRVEVSDTHPTVPKASRPDAHSTYGRGLLLVESLSDHWGVAPHAAGKGVWFSLDR
jgi:anti-sigma regulatory factor (Ser/Thr protein kinase)